MSEKMMERRSLWGELRIAKGVEMEIKRKEAMEEAEMEHIAMAAEHLKRVAEAKKKARELLRTYLLALLVYVRWLSFHSHNTGLLLSSSCLLLVEQCKRTPKLLG